jgi:ferric-dicitrate binding protein FerR (iron transport regulator)
MSQTLSHELLVLRALDRVPPKERAAIDQQLEADPVARQRYEQIAQHLALYESFPQAPAAPTFSRVLERLEARPVGRIARMDRPRAVAPTSGRRVVALGAIAAALVVGVFVWTGRPADKVVTGPGSVNGDAVGRTWVAARGPGIEFRVPDTIQETRDVRTDNGQDGHETMVLPPETVIIAAREPARVELVGKVAVVLDRASPLQVKQERVLRLEAGRAHFVARPGDLRIETPYGDVDVVGTAFEIDLRLGALAVRVEEGVVRVGPQRIEAGQALEGGQVSAQQEAVGSWFRDPQLLLHRSDATLVPGAPLRFELTFANPALVELRGPGPEGWLTALSAEIWEARAPEERLPLSLHEENLVRGQDLLEPGRPLVLRAGERRTLGLQLRSPIPRPGNWRLRVWYRPAEGRAQVPSDVLELEVR